MCPSFTWSQSDFSERSGVEIISCQSQGDEERGFFIFYGHGNRICAFNERDSFGKYWSQRLSCYHKKSPRVDICFDVTIFYAATPLESPDKSSNRRSLLDIIFWLCVSFPVTAAEHLPTAKIGESCHDHLSFPAAAVVAVDLAAEFTSMCLSSHCLCCYCATTTGECLRVLCYSRCITDRSMGCVTTTSVWMWETKSEATPVRRWINKVNKLMKDEITFDLTLPFRVAGHNYCEEMAERGSF